MHIYILKKFSKQVSGTRVGIRFLVQGLDLTMIMIVIRIAHFAYGNSIMITLSQTCDHIWNSYSLVLTPTLSVQCCVAHLSRCQSCLRSFCQVKTVVQWLLWQKKSRREWIRPWSDQRENYGEYIITIHLRFLNAINQALCPPEDVSRDFWLHIK